MPGKCVRLKHAILCCSYTCAAPWMMTNVGLNDIYVISIAMHELRELKHGWFSQQHKGCHTGAGTEGTGGHCNPCVGDPNEPNKPPVSTRLSSPFWIEG